MLFDLNSPDAGQALSEKYFDVCIAGAGVAGILLAKRLSEAGKSVLLLEAGGEEISAESQQLYQGENVGMEYLDLRTCRLRYLGGTSNHWNGWCRALDAYDFEAKDHIRYSGWPIEKRDVLPYEEETYEILDIPDRPTPNEAFPEAEGTLDWIAMSFSAPTRFREKYSDVLDSSDSISLVLNANVTDFRLDESGSHIASVICRSYAEVDRDHRFKADLFVLAMGGIENARALLNANSQISEGIGNESDLVGRFFSDHPHFDAGIYWERASDHPTRFLATTPALLKRERIGNCVLRLFGYSSWPVEHFDIESAKNLARNLACSVELVEDLFTSLGRTVPCDDFGRIQAVWEQVPNPDSRVTLSESRDKFGLRTTVLDWRWTPTERKTVRSAVVELGKAFARADRGRIKVEDWVLDESLPLPTTGELAGRHHMGTTRMSNDPTTGVVDKNCRVFGLDNFYVAGSSVFTTFGHANPTFTIVQLTLRLADHLEQLKV